MQRRRNSLLIGSALAAATLVAGMLLYANLRPGETAHASPAPEILSALPAGAPTLVYLDLAAVRASGFYRHRPNPGPITLPNKDYTNFIQSTGFDFEKDLDRVVIASWPPSLSKEPKKTVAVADGRFDREKIRDYAMRKGKLDHQEGKEVFLFPAGNGASWNSIVFLDDHRIALIEGPSIAPLFANASATDAVGDPARERAARVDGAAAFAITRVPPVPANFAPGGAQSAELAAMARSVQWITLAAQPEGDNLRVSLEGECDNDADARQLQAALQLLRMFGRASLESPKTRQSMDPAAFGVLQSVLNDADIAAAGERVRILVELTPAILKLGEAHKSQ